MQPSMNGGSRRIGPVATAAALLGLALSAFAGCGGNGTVSTTGSGSGSTGEVITGAGGGPGHTTSSSSSTGMGGGMGGSTTSSMSTGTGIPKLGAPYPIVLCHGFFGFDKLAGVQQLPYFYHVPERLAEDGETEVFTPAVDPFNSSDFRADQLIGHVEDILEMTG